MASGTGEKKRGVRAKKVLGQHFLHDQNTATKIVNSIIVAPGAVLPLLEIGPGMGVLTRLLVKRADIDLKVIEIDRESVAYLRESHSKEISSRRTCPNFSQAASRSSAIFLTTSRRRSSSECSATGNGSTR